MSQPTQHPIFLPEGWSSAIPQLPFMNLFQFQFFRAVSVITLFQASSSLHAAIVPAPAAGDIFVGFRASSGQGAETSYLVKLGPDTTFRNAAQGTSFTVSGIGNVGADLTAAYGEAWHLRNDLQWGIFGVRPGVNSTVYGSRVRSVQNTISPAWPALTSTSRNGTAGAITSVMEEVGGYKGRDATPNSTVAALQPNFGGAASYHFQVATPGTSDLSSLSQWTSIEGSFANGPANAVLDLFRIGSAVSHVGSFAIDTTGSIRFTAVPVPATADSDGDGFTDAEEALAGTNPNHGGDFLRTVLSPAVNGLRVQTSVTAANRTYLVEYSETLAAGPWITIQTHLSGAGSAPVDFVDSDPTRQARAKGFYRVRVSS
jgi:hypothetical protein